jgi:transposase
MLHAGLDLSRNRLDVCLLSEQGELVEEFAVPSDDDGVRGLARRVLEHGAPVRGVIESMTGARFVHDTLERHGWDVLIADAQRVKGLAPLACKTDRIDARVLAVLSERGLVPAIWLPDPAVRREREQARFRLHLVKHRSMLKHRIHSTLITFGKPCPVTDLFGVAGRELLDRLDIPQPWRSTVDASIALIDDLERQIAEINHQLRDGAADHAYVPLLSTAPGIGWVLAFTIAAEIGDITRFSSPKSSAATRGSAHASISRATKTTAGRSQNTVRITCAGRCSRQPCMPSSIRSIASATSGKQGGAKVAQIDIARRLSEAIWHMLTNNQPFAPAPAAPLFVWPPDALFELRPRSGLP